MRYLILIASCVKNADRRAAQRETWLTKLLPDMTPLFYVGHGAKVDEPNTVQLYVEDNYEALPHKMHAAVSYAAANFTFDYMFRVDDDTYAVPARFDSLFWQPGMEMIGGDIMSEHQWSTGGAGLMFSRRLVDCMVKTPPRTPCPDCDDGWACEVGRKNKAKFYWTPRLQHENKPLPHPRNDMVTGHHLSPDEMRRLHRTFYPTD
jgi:hypothetical protein